ncbi:MAG: ROK family protein [Candidatus Doudnabacteria bacterium]|nr:ROK family protein [Candidatus Doudnabacteria bacterium]
MFAVIDVGASKSRIAFCRNLRNLGQVEVFSTQADFSGQMSMLRKRLHKMQNKGSLRAVACGVAGTLDAKKNRIVNTGHLPRWHGKYLGDALRKVFRAPVFLENDTALAGLGEARRGAGRRYAVVAYVTVSTGVNGVRIVDGKIDRNVSGFGIGHQIISVINQKPQTLEHFIAGAELRARFGKAPEKIASKSVWKDVERYLGYGLVNVLRFWSPGVLVVGGGIIAGEKINLSNVKRIAVAYARHYAESCPFLKAQLGDYGGLYGGLEFLSRMG